MYNRHNLGLLMRKLDEMSATLSFSEKYCSTVAEKAMKTLVFMYHEAMSTFFWVLKMT